MALHWNIESREKLVVVVADGNVEMEEAERATWAVSAIVSTGSTPPVITCRAAWNRPLQLDCSIAARRMPFLDL